MKAKTARTLLMAGTIIGGVLYFSQTAKAQDTRLKTMTTENRMLYNTKEQLAQQVTGASNEFAAQGLIERDLITLENSVRTRRERIALLETTIQQKLADGTWMTAEDVTNDPAIMNLPYHDRINAFNNIYFPLIDAQEEVSTLQSELTSLHSQLRTKVADNQRSWTYRRDNLIL